MKARGLIAGAAFGPPVLRVLYEAFDSAWEEIRHRYGDDQAAISAARINLAHALLAVASENDTDSRHVKSLALQVVRGAN